MKRIATLLAAVLALLLLTATVASAATASTTAFVIAQTDPDDDGKGPDRGEGGPDDEDDNKGCGNDDDRDDDNEGNCPKYPPKKPKPPKPPKGGPGFSSFLLASTNSPTAAAGTAVDATGSGWQADSQVEVSIIGDDGQAQGLGAFPVDESGEFSANVAIPADVPAGAQPLAVKGTDARGQLRTEKIPLIVTSPAATATPEQAGTVITVGMAALAALVVVGGAAMALRRRRLANNHFGR